MGSDGFHEKYPDATEGGLRNNAHTNVMVAWIADTARTVVALLPESRREAVRPPRAHRRGHRPDG